MSDYGMVGKMFVSGLTQLFVSSLLGIIGSMLLKISYCDAWSIFICLVSITIGMLILFKENLPCTKIILLAHFLFASVIGLIALLFSLKYNFWVVSSSLLPTVTFSVIAVLGLVIIGGFLSEIYKRFR